jgi:hypothetical protein
LLIAKYHIKLASIPLFNFFNSFSLAFYNKKNIEKALKM